MRKFSLATALALATPAGVHAQQQADSMNMGTQTCEVYLAARQMNSTMTDVTFISWASGFMTGVNLGKLAQGQAEKNLVGMPLELQKGVVRQYCNRNPSKTFLDAVIDLYTQLPDFSGD